MLLLLLMSVVICSHGEQEVGSVRHGAELLVGKLLLAARSRRLHLRLLLDLRLVMMMMMVMLELGVVVERRLLAHEGARVRSQRVAQAHAVRVMLMLLLGCL